MLDWGASCEESKKVGLDSSRLARALTFSLFQSYTMEKDDDDGGSVDPSFWDPTTLFSNADTSSTVDFAAILLNQPIAEKYKKRCRAIWERGEIRPPLNLLSKQSGSFHALFLLGYYSNTEALCRRRCEQTL